MHEADIWPVYNLSKCNVVDEFKRRYNGVNIVNEYQEDIQSKTGSMCHAAFESDLIRRDGLNFNLLLTVWIERMHPR